MCANRDVFYADNLQTPRARTFVRNSIYIDKHKRARALPVSVQCALSIIFIDVPFAVSVRCASAATATAAAAAGICCVFLGDVRPRKVQSNRLESSPLGVVSIATTDCAREGGRKSRARARSCCCASRPRVYPLLPFFLHFPPSASSPPQRSSATATIVSLPTATHTAQTDTQPTTAVRPLSSASMRPPRLQPIRTAAATTAPPTTATDSRPPISSTRRASRSHRRPTPGRCRRASPSSR